MWSQLKIKNHLLACELLDKIKDLAFEFIKNNLDITELEVEQFILKEIRKNKLTTCKKYPDLIVAFNEFASFPHYNPHENPKKLKENSLILIDIWGKLNEKNSPFSDITWMGYYGKEIPEEMQQV